MVSPSTERNCHALAASACSAWLFLDLEAPETCGNPNPSREAGCWPNLPPVPRQSHPGLRGATELERDLGPTAQIEPGTCF